MSACKLCGCYLRSRNVSGYCREHMHVIKAANMRHCTECPAVIDDRNVTGLCNRHFVAAKAAGAMKLDDTIAAALVAGATADEVVRKMGVGSYRVRRIYETLVVTMPTRRIADLIAAAAAHSNLTTEQITGPFRFRPIIMARQAVCLLAPEAGHSSTLVGMSLGGRDHSTILHGRDTARERAKRDPSYAAFIASVASGSAPAPVVVEPLDEDIAPPTPPPAEVAAVERAALTPRPRYARPRNDFRATEEDGQDESHLFHTNIAAGSRALARAILLARAA